MSRFKCDICDNTFNRKDSLKRHHLLVHKAPKEDDDHVDKTSCIHPGCTILFYHKTKMLEHLEKEHCIDSTRSVHTFATEADFQAWKEKEEVTNFVYFSKQCGVHKGKSFWYSYYICQHDGSEMPHRSKDKPARKTDRKNTKGQIKTGGTCPARMMVKMPLDSQEISITYIRTHNHPISFKDTQHQPIPKTIKGEIEGKIALGIPSGQIIKDLRGGQGGRENREEESIAQGQMRAYNFIKRRLVAEMQRKMKANCRLHASDSMSTYLLIDKLSQESFNPVLIYKPKGDGVFFGDPQFGELPDTKDIFAVGIQTKEQLAMMNEKEILCIDGTHGTNQYGYGLTNILVPDEFGKGYPVGHFISNRHDEKSLYYFFKEIKNRCPNMKIYVIMSDDDYSGPNAIKAVFGQHIKHFLCKWHIHRAWMRRLRQDISTDENLRNEVWHCLLVMMDEKSPTKFWELVESFQQKYSPLCPSFTDYFQSNYLNRVETWAMCHRNFPHAKSDTNMLVEAFHNRLKTFFMKRMPNRRIDGLINLLLEIEEEDYWRRRGDIAYENTKGHSTGSRHKDGLNIADEDLDSVSQDEWRVKSQTVSDMWYTVTVLKPHCLDDHCYNKCTELACTGLCSHMNHCNCQDQSMLCKHIHKVHAFINRMKQKKQENKYKEKPFQPEVDHISFTSTDEVPDDEPQIGWGNSRLLEETNTNLSKLKEFLSDDTVVQTLLPHIHANLKKMLAQCNAVISAKNKVVCSKDIGPKIKMAPNEKLQLQLPPMKKAPKRKAPISFFKGPTAQQRVDITNKLLDDQSPNDDGNQSPNAGGSSTDVMASKVKLEKHSDPNESTDVMASKVKLEKHSDPNESKSDNTSQHNWKQPRNPSKLGKRVPSKPRINLANDLKTGNSTPNPNPIVSKELKTSQEKVGTQAVQSHSGFTPLLGRDIDPNTKLLKYGPHNLTLINLKSLEPFLRPGEEIALKACDDIFCTGELFDEVINAYFYRLQSENSHVAYVASTSLQVLMVSQRVSARTAWANIINVKDKDFIFFPWNPTGRHWVLIAIDLRKNAVMYMDPLHNVLSIHAQEVFNVLEGILQQKFGMKDISLQFPDKCLQRDGNSCGVYVCYYGQQLTKGAPLTDQLLPVAFRRTIYDNLTGKCTISLCSERKDTCATCKEEGSGGMVQCDRCSQWYHCSCANITEDEAKALNTFFCH